MNLMMNHKRSETLFVRCIPVTYALSYKHSLVHQCQFESAPVSVTWLFQSDTCTDTGFCTTSLTHQYWTAKVKQQQINKPHEQKKVGVTCLSRNSLVSFSMCPSYRFVVKLIRPIFERPKSVSLMCPIDVMRRLNEKTSIYQTAQW